MAVVHPLADGLVTNGEIQQQIIRLYARNSKRFRGNRSDSKMMLQFWENLYETVSAVIEDAVQLLPDDPAMGDIADKAPLQGVMDDVGHFDALRRDSRKEMLMMPEAVGPDALFVHEEMGPGCMGDLGHPAHGIRP